MLFSGGVQEFLGIVNAFTLKGLSETSPIMHLKKHISQSQKLQKYLTYETHFFFENIGKLMYILKK